MRTWFAFSVLLLACGDSGEVVLDTSEVFVPDTDVVMSEVAPDTSPARDSAVPETLVDTSAPATQRDDATVVDDSVADTSVEADTSPACDSPFVYLKDKQLWLGDAPWFPLSANFSFDIRHTPEGDYYVGPHGSHCQTPDNCCNDRASCLAAVRAQLAQVKAMGLNSLRIVGLAVIPQDGTVVLDCAHQWPDWLDYCPKEARLVMDPPDPRGLALIADALALVKEAGLNGILLAGHHALDAPVVRDSYTRYLTALASRFADEPTLFAYDLMNEPVYELADKDIAKVDANAIGRAWYDAVRAGSSRHMVTWGLAELGAVRHWDPGALPMDFVSFHIYGPGNWSAAVRDYLTTFFGWMGREAQPMLVGEIGISADPEGVTEDEQLYFAEHALATAYACGSMGFQWWMYRDVSWGPTGFGLVRRDGSEKPVVAAFEAFDPDSRGTCPTLDYLGNAPDALNITTGKVVREDGTPVANALVSGHKCFTGGYDWTLTDADGAFALRSTSLIAELEVTASGLSLEKLPLGCNIVAPGDVVLRALPLRMDLSTPSVCPQ